MRVGVVMGGTSSEREISLRSGEAVAVALEEAGHDVVRVELGAGIDALDALASADMDVAFLALHGKQGEDGCVQGVLEMLGIPYTGSGVLTSALAMDKLKSKELFRLHNVPTPPYYAVHRRNVAELAEVHGSFGFPVVVKPRREGSSVGVAKAENLSELVAAVDNALLYDDSVLVERFIKAREIAVGVLDGRVLGAIEIQPDGELYDFRAKYQSDATQYFLPARVGDTRLLGILNLAQRTVDALDVRGAARVDLLVTEGMNEYVLEVNTLPGMTETSLLPKIARAAGYDFTSLCLAILETARLDSGLGMQTLVRSSMEQADESIWEEAAFDDALPAVARSGRSSQSSARKSA
ncbi:MAG TPA: D-alanine--D-alanine ligase [Polyangiaceae bacterium]|nr:D-alanine--D-alanine ligase [Polyangiaceae bacterium]